MKTEKFIPFTMALYEEFSETDKTLPVMIHVAPLGKWDHPVYGEFEVTRDTVREFVDNFNNGIRKPKLPITAGHDSFEEHKAIGWMTELQEGVNGLYAVVEWTVDGKDLLLKGSFKYFSPEWFTSYTDPADGKEYGHVLIGGALTNKPFFRELESVVAFSENVIYQRNSTIMDLETIRAKEAADITAEEKEFLSENVASLTAEEKEKFGFPVEEETEETTEETEETKEETEEVTTGETEAEAEATTGETEVAAHVASTVTMTAQQFNELAAQAEMGRKALQEVRTMTLAREVEQLVFSDTNKAGRFLPKDKSAVLSFMSTLEDKQRKAFNELIARIPAQSLFNELGTGDDHAVADDPATELDAKIASLRSEDKALDYRTAVTRVFKENPELAKKYEAKYGGAQ